MHAFDVDRDGHMAVFNHISGAVTCGADKFIPASNDARPLSPRAARDLFIRAWGAVSMDLESLPPWAFGKA